MEAFAALYAALDQTTGLSAKQRALANYFRATGELGAALWLLRGGRVSRVASPAELRRWLAELTGLPDWLIDDSHAHVGDLAETVALLLPPVTAPAATPSLTALLANLTALRGASEATRRAAVIGYWQQFPQHLQLVLNKLLTGALRVGVGQGLVARALAEAFDRDSGEIADLLAGQSLLDDRVLAALRSGHKLARDGLDPYPFCLASSLADDESLLGDLRQVHVEWKWDGIRAQIVRRRGLRLWSRGEEALDGRFPELEAAFAELAPGTVLDGEILIFDGDRPRPFAALQPRIARLKPNSRLLREAPASFVAYDLLEAEGIDLRPLTFAERRARLEALARHWQAPLRLSAALPVGNRADVEELRKQARAHGVEGLMLKHLASPYRTGRKRGTWVKYKLDPLTIDAVLVYAQAGHGRRANLHTDLSFALWHEGRLVVCAKAYSGLSDEEMQGLERYIRSHTLSRHGPVRVVSPELVFELGFESVQRSTRHKSGVAVRFPRILRWRHDKRAADANQLADLLALG